MKFFSTALGKQVAVLVGLLLAVVVNWLAQLQVSTQDQTYVGIAVFVGTLLVHALDPSIPNLPSTPVDPTSTPLLPPV